jgi:hypothetical protein
MSLTRFWNGKLSGLFAAIWYFFAAGCRLLSRSAASFLQCSRLGRHGKNCHIGRNVTINHPGKIEFGNGVSIGDDVFISAEFPGSCKIANDVHIDRLTRLDFSGNLRIGSGVTISEAVVIETHTHGYAPRSKPMPCNLTIGNNVWIGMRAVILPQVGTIGDNAIIGAGAVVAKPVPPNSIVVGVPATVAKVVVNAGKSAISAEHDDP